MEMIYLLSKLIIILRVNYKLCKEKSMMKIKIPFEKIIIKLDSNFKKWLTLLFKIRGNLKKKPKILNVLLFN